MRRLLLALLVLAFIVAACGEGEPTTTSPAVTTSTTSAPAVSATTAPPTKTTTSVVSAADYFSVYMMLDTSSSEPGPFLVPLSRYGGGPATPLEAAHMLMRGLAFSEVGMGLSTAVPMTPEPPDALSVTIDGSVATVDLTSIFETGGGGGTFQMAGRLAQVVFTLTQFDEIDAVMFKIEGEPITVFSSEGILVEEPAFGASVELPLDMHGLANVPDEAVHYALTDWDGLIVAEGVAAVGGLEFAGYGTFEVTIDVPPPDGGLGSLIVWVESPDGSQQWIMEYPLSLAE